MTEPAYIPVKTREMDHLGLVNRNADREEKRRETDIMAQAKAIMSRPNAVSSTGQLNPNVVSRDEARIVLASGLTDRAPTRLSQARSIQPWEAAGNVVGGVLGEAHRMSQRTAGSLARVVPTPEKDNARRIYDEAKSMGMTDEQAARAAWQGINAPWGVKGAIELATDPLNLLPGVGFGGAIARGTGAVARGTGRGLAAGARALGDPLEEALTGGMRVPGMRAPAMGGRLSFVPEGPGRPTGTGGQPDPRGVPYEDTDLVERYTQYEREFRRKTGTIPEGSGSFGVPSGSRSRAFHRGINRVRRNESGLDIYGAAVDVKPQRFYADPSTTLFLDARGTAGAAVSQEGELVSVFKLKGQTDTDMGALLNEATKGSRFLDAFDINGVLPDLYAKHGFRAVARVTFDPAVAPKGWDISKLGTPDIVFMVRDTNGVTGLTDIVESGGYASIRETVPLVPYDEAIRLRDLVLQKMPQRAPTAGTGRTTRRAGDPSTLRAINTANVTFNVGRKAYNMAFADLEDKALYLAGETGKKRGKVSQDLALDHLERRTGRPRADLLAEAKQYNREVKQWVRKAKPKPGDTSVPRPQSEPLYRIPDDPTAVPIAKLPDDLGGAKPEYRMGRKRYVPQFENDIDKSLFIVAQKAQSKRDPAYMDWLRSQLPDLSDEQIRSAGVDVRAHIKATVKGAPEGDVVIPRSKFVQESAAAKKTDTTLGDRIDELDESVDDYLNTPGSMGDAEHRQKLDAILKEVGFAANIRLAKYSSDQASELARWAAEHPDEIEAATRGVVSDDQVLTNGKKLVQSVGGDEEALIKRWRAGQAWNAEEITAIRGALAERTQAVMDQAKRVNDPTTSGPAEVAKLFIAMERHAAVQKVVHGITSEAGRALRSFRQEAREHIFFNKDIKAIQRLITRAGGTEETLIAYAKEIARAAVMPEGLEKTLKIQGILERAYKPTGFEKVMELWINSILSGPKTHIINILSNTANAVASPFERLGAAFVDNIVAPLQGRQRERFYNEAIRDAAAWKGGIQDGIYAGFMALRQGSNPSAASKYEFRRKAIKGRIGGIVRLPGTLLEAADAMHSTINLASAKNALAYRRAAKQGLDGADLEKEVYELLHNPRHKGYYDLHKEALEHAEYRLFRNEVGENLQKIMELRQKVPILRFIMPFMRTPANLLTYGVARSPLAFAPIPLGMLSRSKINIGMWKTLAEKNPEFSDQFARAFLGTMAASALAFGVAKGRITGATPQTEGARDRFYREGKLPYSIRIGNHWIQYSRLEPFNQVLAQIAAVFPEEGWEDDDETVASNASRVVFSIGENMISQTYMSGLSDLIAALRNPEMFSDSYLGRVASGLIPASSLLRTIAGIQDPTIRKPVKESAFPGTILDRMAMTFPAVPGFEGQRGLGGRTGTQAKLTAFGEETRIPRAAVLSPIQFRKAQQSEVDRQLDLLGVEVGFVSNSVGGQKLTSEQHQEYKRLAGQLTLAALMQLVERPGFGDMSIERRENLILDTISSARRRARGQMLRLLRQSGAYVGRGSAVPDTAPEGTGVLGTLGNVLFGSPDAGTEGYDPTAHENYGW